MWRGADPASRLPVIPPLPLDDGFSDVTEAEQRQDESRYLSLTRLDRSRKDILCLLVVAAFMSLLWPSLWLSLGSNE